MVGIVWMIWSNWTIEIHRMIRMNRTIRIIGMIRINRIIGMICTETSGQSEYLAHNIMWVQEKLSRTYPLDLKLERLHIIVVNFITRRVERIQIRSVLGFSLEPRVSPSELLHSIRVFLWDWSEPGCNIWACLPTIPVDGSELLFNIESNVLPEQVLETCVSFKSNGYSLASTRGFRVEAFTWNYLVI